MILRYNIQMEQGETGETKTSLLNENCCIICRTPKSQYDNLRMVDELKRKRDNVDDKDGSECAAKRYTRTQSSKFNWKDNCLFCGETCVEDKKHPDRKKMQMATTIPFKERLIFVCQKRDDEWGGEEVRRRVTNCNDLVAVEARYHISCTDERYLGKHGTFKSPSSRPTDSDCLENFELVCECLEAEGELCSLSEVHDKMTEIAKLNESENVYSQKWLKTKLQQKYKEHIFFAEVNAKSNVICFREMANYLVTDAWYNARKENPTEEAERIIETAAKLILNDIRSANFDVKTYPNLGEIESVEDESNYLPPYLQLFMQGLSKKILKGNKHWPSYHSHGAWKILYSSNITWTCSGTGSCFWFKVVNYQVE